MARKQHSTSFTGFLTMSHHDDISSAGLRFAEAVLPGHPDKLADQIADAIVDIALAQDDRAIVQVEVAVHHNICHVNGRVSTAGGALSRAYVEATVRGVYERAGFGVPFEGVGDGTDYQCPQPSQVDVQLSCTISEADPDERAMREYTDDQAIHIGYAIGTPETRWLPMEQHLAWLLRD
jgi:S-adenosylmethionine synthetase